MSKRNPEIRIAGVSEKVHFELTNIAENLGIYLTDLLKPHLRKIAESYPEEMRKPFKKVIVNSDTKVEEKAKMIADMCMPCSKKTWGLIYRNAKEVMNG